jgi:hypothetical protein
MWRINRPTDVSHSHIVRYSSTQSLLPAAPRITASSSPTVSYLKRHFFISTQKFRLKEDIKQAEMAANTRYQPAPQRDSLEEEESPFTRAPPSYEATAEAPRSEDDNVPDDFKVCFLCSLIELITEYKRILTNWVQYGGMVAEATLPIRMQFIRKVYSIL